MTKHDYGHVCAVGHSRWDVPDDYAAQYMSYEAGFCEREAINTRNRGCDDYVINHYKRRAELLREALARLKRVPEIAGLRAALHDYGRCNEGCSGPFGYECKCGWQETKTRLLTSTPRDREE